MRLGCIADDFTGASDVASAIIGQGLSCTIRIGAGALSDASTADAIVVPLKIRTCPPSEAVSQALEAANGLRDHGCEKLLYKVCSTFDSSPNGNIGPVTAALAELMGEDTVIVTPAYPAAARTVFQGHLFVGDRLLSETSMRDHPLTPMRDPDLRRVLAAQTHWEIGHVGTETVFAGADAILEALERQQGRMVILDAIRDEDLFAIGRAARNHKLLTGGSGIALGLAANIDGQSAGTDWRGECGPGAILSGSCSQATLRQVETYRHVGAAFMVNVEDVLDDTFDADGVAEWALRQSQPPLIYSSASPEAVAEIQKSHHRERVAEAIETAFAKLARALVERGAVRLVVAGGETSGAVVKALDLTSLEVGRPIAEGVPALRAANRKLVLALKSGNFGSDDFFERAMQVLKND